jgi:hypothetical protein
MTVVCRKDVSGINLRMVYPRHQPVSLRNIDWYDESNELKQKGKEAIAL